jgi:hypothetical protein
MRRLAAKAHPSFIDWSWGVAPRGLVAGRYQPLADGDTLTAMSPDHARFLQSGQKAKRRRP